MTTTVAINGFGRIGRHVLDVLLEDPHLQIVAINDPFIDAEYIAYLIQHDPALKKPSGKERTIEVTGGATTTNTMMSMDSVTSPSSPGRGLNSVLIGRNKEPQSLLVDGRIINVYGCTDPSQVPWAESKAQYVIDCSGVFTTVERASAHLAGGASRVIISAPSADANTIVLGANEETFKKSWQIMSCGSCTATALAPALKMINDAVPVQEVSFTSIHAVTGQQGSVDGTNVKDYRLGRASGNNIVPCSTGALKTLSKVLPAFNGKVFGSAVRVPVSQSSLLDVTITLEKPASKAQMDALFTSATGDPRYGKLIGVVDAPIVSGDISGSITSCVYDKQLSAQLGDSGLKHKLMLWYDNERGYAARLVDLVLMTANEW